VKLEELIIIIQLQATQNVHAFHQPYGVQNHFHALAIAPMLFDNPVASIVLIIIGMEPIAYNVQQFPSPLLKQHSIMVNHVAVNLNIHGKLIVVFIAVVAWMVKFGIVTYLVVFVVIRKYW